MTKKKADGDQEKPKRGRPTDLTPEVREKILYAIRLGNFRHVSAEYAGISGNTLAQWCVRGRKEGQGLYYEFLQQLLEAERGVEIKSAGRIISDPDVKHLEWWLERKYPDRWGKDRDLLRELVKRVRELEGRLGANPPPPAPEG